MARSDIGRSRSSGIPRACLAALLLLCAAVVPGRADPGGDAGGLAGIVLDPLGRALPGVEIRLGPPGVVAPPAATARSDERGRFLVRGLAPGVYRLVAIKGGYAVLVDRVDTFLRHSLELVLHPAPGSAPGTPATPGRSWALRLPRRDVLEQAAWDPSPATERRDSSSVRLAMELAPASFDAGAGGEGSGVDLGIHARLHPRTGGRMSVALDHRGARGDGGLEEQLDRLRFSGRRSLAAGALLADLDVVGLRRRAFREDPGIAAELRGWMLESRVRGRLPGGGWEGFARARYFDGVQAGIGTSGHRVAVGGELHRSTGPHGEMIVRAAFADAVDGFAGEGGDEPLVLTALAPREGASLDELLGASLDMDAEVAWSLSRDTRLGVSVRGVLVDGRGTRWTGWSTAEWHPGTGWFLAASGGLAAGADGPATPALRIAAGREREAWSWSLERARDAGPVPGGAPAAVADPLFLASRSARIDSWRAGLTTRIGGPAGVALHLRAESGRMSGTIAPRLPGDLPMVPVIGDGRARFASLSGRVAILGGRTRIGLAWRRIEDRGTGGGLLAGAGRWIDREIEVVQRLGDPTGRGYACDLLLRFGRTRTEGSGEGEGRPERWAFLHRDRVAGGLRVAF